MKFRKIFSIAALLGAALAAICPAAGCHTHSYVWQTTVAATCITGGTETGYCDCGDVITRETDPDPDGHSYGAWEVTKIPTEMETGLAVKTCLYDSSHTYEYVLPLIDDEAYTSYVYEDPTAVLTGTRRYILTVGEGIDDIRFDVEIPPHDIECVEDAIEVAVAHKSNVRYASGSVISNYGKSSISYRYGTDSDTGNSYTYIYDGADNKERWLTRRADGSVVGFYKDYSLSTVSLTYDSNESEGRTSYIDGYRFVFTYTESTVYYGAEALLAGMYEWAQIGYDINESMDEEDGETVYSLSYKYNGSYSSKPSSMSIKFTLTEDGSLGYLYAVSKTVSSDGTTTYTDGVELTQTTIGELGEDYVDTAHASDYTPENTLISSFEVLYNGNSITGALPFAAGSSYTSLTVSNITPSTASLTADPVTVYIRDSEGNEEEVVFGSPASDGHIYGSLDKSSGKFTFNPSKKGSYTLIFRSIEYSQEVDVVITSGAPSAIYPNLYIYDAGTGTYYWQQISNDDKITLYENESIMFTAWVQYGYEDTSITNISPGAENMNMYSLTEVEVGGETLHKLSYNTAGTYNVIFDAALNSVQGNFFVEVIEAPAIADTLKGSYASADGSVTVEFESVEGSYGDVIATITQFVGGKSSGSQVYLVTFDTTTNEIVSFEKYGTGTYLYDYYDLTVYGESVILKYTTEFGRAMTIECFKVEDE